MPCYDKKLEASRKEFLLNSKQILNLENEDKNDDIMIPEVDCVITAIEIEQMLQTKNIKSFEKYETSLQSTLLSDKQFLYLLKNNNIFNNEIHIQSDLAIDDRGSNGYMKNLFIAISKHLFNVEIDESNIQYTRLRNDDIEEICLRLNGNQLKSLPFDIIDKNMLETGIVLRCLRAYGFRNIQNITKSIEKNDNKYHYIEIMACPNGCLNGGGLLRIDDLINSKKISFQKEHINQLRRLHVENQHQKHEKIIKYSRKELYQRFNL